MSIELETRIQKLVEAWNAYRYTTGPAVRELQKHLLYCLDCAMEQFLKDTGDKSCKTYHYITDKMPNSDARKALDRIRKIVCTEEQIIIDEEFKKQVKKEMTLWNKEYESICRSKTYL